MALEDLGTRMSGQTYVITLHKRSRIQIVAIYGLMTVFDDAKTGYEYKKTGEAQRPYTVAFLDSCSSRLTTTSTKASIRCSRYDSA